MFRRSTHLPKNRKVAPWLAGLVAVTAIATIPSSSFAGGRYHGGGGRSWGGGSFGHRSHNSFSFSLGLGFGGPIYRSWNDGYYGGSVRYRDYGDCGPSYYTTTYYAPPPVYYAPAPPPVVYYPARTYYYDSCYSTPSTYYQGEARFYYGR